MVTTVLDTVLDKGYVKLVDFMGDDLGPVNDARVSFDKESSEYTERDTRLLNYLGQHGHTSPFRGSVLKFEVYAPLMVARQWWKYVIGSDHAEAPEHGADRFLQWNESSRRYVTESIEFYTPTQWRRVPENKKQGSGGVHPDSISFTQALLKHQEEGQGLYEEALKLGVAPEQARLFLAAYGLYVRFRWTSSLQGVCHLINQRVAKDAQYEFQEYAKAVRNLALEKFPNAVAALIGEENLNA